MSIGPGEIEGVLTGVWTSVLGLDLRRAGEPVFVGEEGPSFLVGAVEIRGAWDGMVTLACSSSFARQIAGIMFRTPPERLAEAEVRDAVGELANITGGNLKALLPSPSELSLPMVVLGHDFFAKRVGRVVGEGAFECHGHLLLFQLFEARPSGKL